MHTPGFPSSGACSWTDGSASAWTWVVPCVGWRGLRLRGWPTWSQLWAQDSFWAVSVPFGFRDTSVTWSRRDETLERRIIKGMSNFHLSGLCRSVSNKTLHFMSPLSDITGFNPLIDLPGFTLIFPSNWMSEMWVCSVRMTQFSHNPWLKLISPPPHPPVSIPSTCNLVRARTTQQTCWARTEGLNDQSAHCVLMTMTLSKSLMWLWCFNNNWDNTDWIHAKDNVRLHCANTYSHWEHLLRSSVSKLSTEYISLVYNHPVNFLYVQTRQDFFDRGDCSCEAQEYISLY